MVVDAAGHPVAGTGQILCCPDYSERSEDVRMEPAMSMPMGDSYWSFLRFLAPADAVAGRGCYGASEPRTKWSATSLFSWGSRSALVVTRPSNFRVKVVDPEGNPVSARKRFWPSATRSLRRFRRAPPAKPKGEKIEHARPNIDGPPLAGTTDERGICTVPWLQRNDLHDIEVRYERLRPTEISFQRWFARRRTSRSTLSCPQIRGRVVADQRDAIRGVVVKFTSGFQGGLAEVTTDADGRFSVAAIAAGTTWAQVARIPDPAYSKSRWMPCGPSRAGYTTSPSTSDKQCRSAPW